MKMDKKSTMKQSLISGCVCSGCFASCTGACAISCHSYCKGGCGGCVHQTYN